MSDRNDTLADMPLLYFFPDEARILGEGTWQNPYHLEVDQNPTGLVKHILKYIKGKEVFIFIQNSTIRFFTYEQYLIAELCTIPKDDPLAFPMGQYAVETVRQEIREQGGSLHISEILQTCIDAYTVAVNIHPDKPAHWRMLAMAVRHVPVGSQRAAMQIEILARLLIANARGSETIVVSFILNASRNNTYPKYVREILGKLATDILPK